MSVTIPGPFASSAAVRRDQSGAARFALPIYLYAVSLAALLTVVGVLWDISWHRSIGRDKFLSPPHMLIYLGAIFAGLFSGLQVLWNSIKRRETSRATEIRVWGIFYSPLGSLFCIWGAIAMLTSAPFDDWWHNTYGLDVTILSPPHTLLAMGMIFLQFGACVSISKYLNTQGEATQSAQFSGLRLLFVIGASSLLVMVYTLFTEYLHPHGMRAPLFYIIVTVLSLLFLPAFGRVLRLRWGMTAVALGYTVIVAGSNWILQLFPAEPRLGPILTHTTHFQPGYFPLLVVFPAIALDWIGQRSRGNQWIAALWMSVAFVGLLLVIQYPFGGFLVESPGSRNWFFGGNTWYFADPPDAPRRYHFLPRDFIPMTVLVQGLLVAVALGILCARIGLRWGKWLVNLQR